MGVGGFTYSLLQLLKTRFHNFTWGVLKISPTKPHNMKFVLFTLPVVAIAQVSAALGGWQDMSCEAGSMCEKRFKKFLVPKIKEQLGDSECEWSFCHVDSGKYQIVHGMNLDITGYVMAMNDGCNHATKYKKCNVNALVKNRNLENLVIDCEDRPMSEMPGMEMM